MKIYNTYDQLKKAVESGLIKKEQAVAISFVTGRVQVWSPFFQTDPNAHWKDEHQKTFNYIGSFRKQQAYDAALAWVKVHYGIDEFVGNAMRDKVPTIVQEKFPIKRS